VNIIDIDAHPPLDEKKRTEFTKALAALGIRTALGAPQTEGLTARECNRRAMADFNCRSLWGHPDCADMLESASLITVDAPWMADAGEVLAIAENRRIPVLLQNETAEQIRALAETHPALTLIAGGFSPRPIMPAPMAELMSVHPRLFLNLSGLIWHGNYIMHEWIKKLPTDRILFGTAYPFGNPASKLAGLRWELRDTDSSVIDGIFGGNASRLYTEVR